MSLRLWRAQQVCYKVCSNNRYRCRCCCCCCCCCGGGSQFCSGSLCCYESGGGCCCSSYASLLVVADSHGSLLRAASSGKQMNEHTNSQQSASRAHLSHCLPTWLRSVVVFTASKCSWWVPNNQHQTRRQVNEAFRSELLLLLLLLLLAPIVSLGCTHSLMRPGKLWIFSLLARTMCSPYLLSTDFANQQRQLTLSMGQILKFLRQNL